MKVKSDKEVHIREGTPYQNNNNKKGVLYTGFEIDVVEQVEGQNIDDNNIWFKDRNGDYYWSGGFEGYSKKTEIIKKPFQEFIEGRFNRSTKKLLGSINYNDLLNFDDNIKRNKGVDTKVAILDYPIKKWDEVFNSRIIDDDFDIQRIGGSHGTLLASIIGANQRTSFGITGLAPRCNLVQLPILYSYKGKNIDEDQILSFLNKHFKNEKIIINASLAYVENEITDNIISFYNTLAKKHILVASAGENKQLLTAHQLQFPSRLTDIISVGVINQEFLEENENPIFSNELDIIIKDFTYIGITHKTNNFYDVIQRDSAATAIVSGVISLLLSSLNEDTNSLNKKNILKKLLEHCISIKEAKNNHQLTLINPKL